MKAEARKRGDPKANGQRPSEEYKRFERLTTRLVRVPKKEIQEQEKKPR